jgi:hypothetical protein
MNWTNSNFGANRICHHILHFLCYSVFLCLSVAAGTCLPNRYLAMVMYVTILFSVFVRKYYIKWSYSLWLSLIWSFWRHSMKLNTYNSSTEHLQVNTALCEVEAYPSVVLASRYSSIWPNYCSYKIFSRYLFNGHVNIHRIWAVSTKIKRNILLL